MSISPIKIYLLARMHSSRMRTARSLTVSRSILRTPPGKKPCMPPKNKTTHTPEKPCTPPRKKHACPPEQPRMSPQSNHTCPPRATMHAHPRATMHALPQGATTHAPPPCGQTDTCKNITFAKFVCGR